MSFPPIAVCTYNRPRSKIFCVSFISLFVRPNYISFIHNPQKLLIMTFLYQPVPSPLLHHINQLSSEELNDLYSSPNIIRVIETRRIKWAGHVARPGERRYVYRMLVGKPEGKRPLGRTRRRWEYNIKMDLQEMGWGAWTGSIWLRIWPGGGYL